jgi:3-methylfumaryl-CoA hydratase
MSADFADWIGRSVVRDDVVTPRLLAEYRATLSPYLFQPRDAEACPPGLHWGIAPATPLAGETGRDGAEAKGLYLPPIPLPRRMWAGGMVETLRPIRPGQHLRRTSTISDIKFREGRTGQLYVLSVSHEIVDGNGVLIRERQDLVFREGAPKAVNAEPARPASGGTAWTVIPTPLLLFRFSAFTFNGHRIHYDAPYAAEEGYPGLVVHGPMQAALMLNLAASLNDEVPWRFEYRCVAPLFGGPPFMVSESDGTLRIIRHDGVTTAEGQAHAQET